MLFGLLWYIEKGRQANWSAHVPHIARHPGKGNIIYLPGKTTIDVSIVFYAPGIPRQLHIVRNSTWRNCEIVILRFWRSAFSVGTHHRSPHGQCPDTIPFVPFLLPAPSRANVYSLRSIVIEYYLLCPTYLEEAVDCRAWGRLVVTSQSATWKGIRMGLSAQLCKTRRCL